MDLTTARVIWEAQGQDPVISPTFSLTPTVIGTYWVEAEAQWPDGRRVSAITLLSVHDTTGTEFQSDANTLALFHFNTNYSDSSGNGYTLTPAGGVSLAGDNLGWMANPAGQVARFHNLGDTLSMTMHDSVVMPGKTALPLTVEARIFPRAYKAYGVNNYDIISLVQNYDTEIELRDGKWNSPAGPCLFVPGSTTVVSSAQWNSAISFNGWHSLKIVFDPAGSSRCYIDGNLISNNPATFNYTRSNDWTLTLGNFDGDIDEVRISNVVR